MRYMFTTVFVTNKQIPVTLPRKTKRTTITFTDRRSYPGVRWFSRRLSRFFDGLRVVPTTMLHRSPHSITPRRCSKLHLRTLCRHLLYSSQFLLQEVFKKPNFLPYFSSVVRLSRTEHVRTFSCIFFHLFQIRFSWDCVSSKNRHPSEMKFGRGISNGTKLVLNTYWEHPYDMCMES